MLASMIDGLYRIERQWRKLGAGWSLLGAGAVWIGYRATGAALFALSVLCQFISWRAMRAAQRAQDARIARMLER